MNHLHSVRTNIMYSKDSKDVYKRFQELIFLVDKPTYKLSNDGEVVREREIEELRFAVSEAAFEELIKILNKLKEANESELS